MQQNNTNKFKFNTKPNVVGGITPNVPQNRPVQNVPNNLYQNSRSFYPPPQPPQPQPHSRTFIQQPHRPKEVKEVIVLDEDLDDISDNELIRASQVVESQLMFTNNVHHTTSNAMNIFSQVNTNISMYNNEPSCSMGPPLHPISANNCTTIYSNSNLNDPFVQVDDLKNELKHVKSENMQKDGEVILDNVFANHYRYARSTKILFLLVQFQIRNDF
jgi:hypothetical protein